MSSNYSIVANQLTKIFGEFKAVDEISFHVEKGEIFGFLGANGAGKTTAMRMLTGLIKPTSGKATVAGFDVFTESEQIKRNIGYMSQKFSLYQDLKVWENIEFYGGLYGMNKGLGDIYDRVIGFKTYNTNTGLFSISIIHKPNIVFLDEPTGGVDPVTRRQFWNLIYEAAERGITIFVTTHYMDEAEYCQRVAIMVDGKIEAMDEPARLKRDFKTNSMDDVFYRLARQAKRSDP